MRSDDLLLNWLEAKEFVSHVEDPIERYFLEVAMAKITMTFFLVSSGTEEEFQSICPIQPFDVLFYVKVMKNVVGNKQRLKRLLDGDLDAYNDFDI